MATGGGWSYHLVNVLRHHNHRTELVFRQVYWARYIDWSIGTSLALVELTVLAGLPGAEIILALFADVTMILFVHLCKKKTDSRVFLLLSRMEKSSGDISLSLL
jgi:bacteriorhodopsin